MVSLLWLARHAERLARRLEREALKRPAEAATPGRAHGRRGEGDDRGGGPAGGGGQHAADPAAPGSEATGCEIWGKAEFMNPGQSVKDRAALWIIRDAVARGALRPGGTIVEGTAGNTGIGLALIGAAMGFRTVIVIPDTQSQEKKDMIRLAGAELVEVPAVPYRNPDNYVRYSGPAGREARRQRSERRGLGQPVRQRGQPPGAYREHGAGDLGADRRAGSTASSAPSARAARWPASPRGCAREAGGADRPRRSLRRGALALLRPRQLKAEGTRSPRVSARAGSPPTSRGSTSTCPTASRTRRRSRRSSTCCTRRGCASGPLGDQRRGRGAHGAGPGPGALIVTVLCDVGTRYQSKLFNPAFLRVEGPAGARLAGAAGSDLPDAWAD